MENNKIPKDIEELYPLSDIQKGMVYHSIMDPDKFIYYTLSVNYVKFKDFDENIFKKAFELMIAKHSILRTGFNMYDFEEPIQIVHKTILPNIKHYDLAGMAEQEQEEYLRKLLANEQQKMFNINNAEILWRVRTLNLGDDNICLIWISHHAIMDGWSFASLMTEVNNTYLKLKENPDFIPVKLKNSYKNFVIEQIMEKKKKENIDFWKIELDDYKRINFPGYFQNTNNKGIRNTIIKKFDDELFNKLKNTARKFDTSLKHLCFGAYIYMLNMFSYENDIVVGIVSNCRPHGPDGDKIIGCFLNTIPVRVKIPYLLRWGDYIRLIDHKLLELKKYDRVSFLEIVKNIGEVSYEKNPLFDTVFNFTDFHVYDGLITKNELFNAPHILNNPFPGGEGGGGHTLFDCTISTTGGFFQIIFNFFEFLISTDRVSTLCSSFEKILYKFVEEADQVVKKEDLISDEEKRKILNDFNNTISEYPDNKTITELFEEQVTLSPGNIACIGSSLGEKRREIFTDENNSFYYHISYKELNEKSEQLAYVLRQKGILPDTIVAIMVKRSIEMLIGIFGILKAGGAYLPIDTEYPPDRIDYMLKDSGTKILITTNGTEGENTGKWAGEIYDIEKLIHLTYPHNILPSCSLNSLSLAYVIYTSGSTGKPKGVMIKHRAMINFIKGIANIIPFTPNDRILSLTTISFDIFGLETIIPLVCGATVLMAGMEEQVDPVAPGIIIEREHISIFQVTPSRLQMMLSLPEVSMSLKILKFLLVGGEAFPGYILEKVRNFVHGRIFNMYGPTETTIWSTVKELRAGEILSVGKPIANTRIYIIDNAGKLQPWGSVGELCIGGDGIARGYLNRPEMTAERFISFPIPVFNVHAFPGQANLFGENPLKQTTGHEMVYKTGDLARWLPDGNIEFLGRIDHQVKVRGFRIELGEIENRLLKCEGIKDVVVLAREEVGGGKYICAYFVSDGECEISELRKSLLKELPDYMIPSYFIRIEQIPLTSNGKIDRNALPKPELKSGGDYVAARNETEKKLLELWSQILDIKIELISIDSNFFELGGHSLKLMTLVAKISKEFNVHVLFTEIFKMPRIRDLAKYIKEKKTELHLSIEPVEEKEYYELASAQKRLYVLQHMNPDSIAYNMPEIISLPGSSDLVKIEETFKNLIKRHESLRTSFYLLNDRPVQKIHKSVIFEIEKNDKIILSDSPKALFNNFVRPFDLSLAPLLRVGLVRNIDGSNILLIDIHHIISDGISNELLIKDFQNLSGGESPLLRVQYKDFSEWQNSGREKENLKRQEKYWLQEYEGEMPVLELPTDYPRPVIQSFEGDYLLFEINANDTIALKNMAMSEEGTLFMVLFALYNILLARLSNSEDIIAGTPVAGRRHADLEKIIGMFVNTLSMRNYPHGEKTFPDYLQEVKQRTLEAFENQDYQFEELVDKLEIVRDVGRNPLFDVMFNYMVIDSGLESVPDEMKSQESKNDFKNTTSKFDLSLTAIERGGGLFFSFQYGTKLFKEETIERFIIYFKKIVSSVIKNSGIRLCEINILSEEEMNWVLNDFNKTGTEYPKDKTIHQLFEEQVEGTPDKIAAVAPFKDVNDESNVHITYRELNEKSGRLAGGLRLKGVGTGTIVGIMAERSIEMVTGMLGILKSGGVYLPLDPEYPRARIDYMLKDSGAKILLTGSEFLNYIDNGPAYPGFLPATNSQLVTSPAYIIYTSGSTGKPKGVLVEHRNVVRLVKNSGYIHYAMPDRLLPTGSVAFDISTFEIWSPLLNCSTLFLVPKEFILNAERLKDSLAKYGITILHMIPQLFNQMADQYIEVFAGLRYFLVGGDLVKPGAVNLLRHTYPHLKIIHCYGPTENTTFSTTFMMENDYDVRIPIGKPIGNSCAYIIDKYNHLQPAGVAGELCVGGDGLARGYLNNLELTAEKFTKGYKSYGSYNTDILYKTGDLARWLHDGNIEFLGRIDHQIKIRGFRVELEEIDSYILKLNGIKEAVALARERDKGDKYICAYFVSDKEYQVSELRQYVSKELPDYMIPSYFVRMEKLPLTTNGKIDKIALPEPEGISLKADTVYALPANPVEKKLVEIWEKVLGRNNIGINENFFMIGGDSIKSIQIISRMNTAGYKLDMKDLFQYPIISDLAPHVKKLKRIPDQSVITGTIPLVPVQVDFFNKCHEDCHHYNQSVMLYAREGFNKEMLKAVFLKIQEHHDALRITYTLNPGNRELVQMGHDLDYSFSLQEYDLKNGGNNLENFNAQLNEIQASIDLENGPLMKLGLFHLDDGDRLLIAIHHLVIDGVSWRILFEDIETLSGQYQRGEKLILPLKTDSFKLWSEKLLEYANSKNFLKEKAYWQKIESVEKKPIPKDFNVDDNYTIDMVNVSFTLSAEETDHLLTKVNEIYRTKINDILLTALGMAIKKKFGHDRIFIAMEGHGREQILEDTDISRTVGWFTSVYPVLMDFSYSGDIGRQIKEIKETLLGIPNKGTGYGLLKYITEQTNKKHMTFKREPQISFNYLGQFDADIKQLSSFQIAKESPGNSQGINSKGEYLLNVSGITANNRLTMTILYNKRHFKTGTLAELMGNLESELKHIIMFCSSINKIEFTPGDFTYKDLSIETVDRLMREYPAIENVYTLTPMQEGMLFHALVDDSSYSYFEQMSYRLEGELNIGIVEKSINELFKRHDILRTIFVYKDLNRPVQVVLKERAVDFYYEDIRLIKEKKEKEVFITNFKQKDKAHSFDLSNHVLMRVAILRVNEFEYEFIWSLHHILMDGWCVGILNNEFFEIYSCYIENKPYRLAEVKPYRTYIDWLEKQDIEESAQYWENYLDSFEEQTGIPKTKKEENGYKNESVFAILDREKTGALNKLAGRSHVTLNIVMQTLWGILLGKYSGKEDVVFGTVVSGRPSELDGVETMVGLFINTIPVRIVFEEKMNFYQLLQVVQEEALAGKSYHFYPLAEIQAKTALKQNLIDHLFIFENYPISEQIKGHENKKNDNNKSLKLANVEIFEQTNYDFNVELGGSDQLRISFKYNGNVYDADWVERISRHFCLAIDQVIENPELEIGALTLLADEEKNRLLYEFNNIEVAYPKDKMIHQLLEAQVEQSPDNIAVVAPSAAISHELPLYITYQELNEKSNRLAQALKRKGVDTDIVVGIMARRSLEMIIGIISIFKAGGAYIPIDVDYPGERIDFILKDSGSAILLTENELLNFSSSFPVSSMAVVKNSSPAIPNRRPATSLAYVIYTSGSTGKPKGAMVDHIGMINHIYAKINDLQISRNSVVAQNSSHTFDISVWQFLAALIQGGKTVIYPDPLVLNPDRLISRLIRDQITILEVVPSYLTVILTSLTENNCTFSHLEYLLVTGEEVKLHLVKQWFEMYPGIKMVNAYGPTEASDDITHHIMDKVPGMDRIPVGKPVQNMNIYIVDRYRQLCPIGVKGEIWVSGIGVGRGYLNDVFKTTQVFIEDPFTNEEGVRLYKTGDLGRWLSNGTIEFFGRTDYQVKIHGFRIELGEIDNRLLNFPGIKEAVVLNRTEENGDTYLCAYIVSDNEYEISELREYLAQELPDYMIPSYFVYMKKIPLTPNGKIDRKALPKPEVKVNKRYIAPRNEIETKLVALWSEILGRDELHISQLKTSIGIDDNFFELGGHSLKATILTAKIHKVFDVKVPLKEIFIMPKIKDLANYIKEKSKEYYFSIEPSEKKEYYLLSSAQKRLYILQQMMLDSITYNMPEAIPLPVEFDGKKIEATFRKLLERHESLRTSYQIINDLPVQVVHDKIDFCLDLHNLKDSHNLQNSIKQIIRPFDLAKPQSIRASLIKKADKSSILIVDMHHIISDGVSHDILVKDFLSLYRGEDLQPLRIQYKDFSEWQNGEKEKEKLKRQEEYWLKEFAGEIPILELPNDYLRPVEQSFEGKSVNFFINEENAAALKAVVRSESSTLFMVLLGIYTILLSKLSGQEDIVIGTAVAGRRHADLEKIIGMFVNTLSLRNYPGGERTFRNFLGELKERTLMSFENQEYPFEELVDNLSLKRDIGRNPLFDTMFVLQNMNTGIENGPSSQADSSPRYENIFKTTKFDLTLSGMERDRGLFLSFEYCIKLFKTGTIERFIDYFKKIVAIAVNEPGIRISEIEILSEEEKNRILFDFNNTQTGYPEHKTIHQLVAEQVQRRPDNIAVFGPSLMAVHPVHPLLLQITYKELNDRARWLAYRLHANGAGPDTIVGIKVARSAEMVMGMLGILKSGGAYLPIDTDYPGERIDYILKDSGAKLMVTHATLEEIPNFNAQLPALSPSNSSSLAYVIYTSGTTGKPKGVLVEHRNVANVISWFSQKTGLGYRTYFLQLSDYTVDPSVDQIFGSLISGASVFIVEKELRMDILRLRNYILLHQVNVVNYVPAYLKELLLADGNKLDCVHTVISAGDNLYNTSKDAIMSYGYRLVNVYGPTETTIDALARDCSPDSPVSLGKPIANIRVYVVDKYGKALSIGIVGELYIGGAGVTRGYLNRPELNKEKFVRISNIDINNKFYRSGDIVRWLEGGNIEMIGRMDHQVKIRGYRIELGEIENRLLKTMGIKDAAVAVQEKDGGDKYICAYFVSDKKYTVPELRDSLAKELPAYMIPAHFIQLENIPLTSNGKIDRKALPGPELKTGNSYKAPGNEIENKLITLWAEVLGVSNIGVDDNFFELGGHSLKATILVPMIHKAFNVKVPLVEIFKKPNIKELAQYINGKSKENYISIVPIEKKEYYDTSYGQKRVWMLSQSQEASLAFNMSATYLLNEATNMDFLKAALESLIARHESLRTVFLWINEDIKQKILLPAEINFQIDYKDIKDIDEKEKVVKDLLESENNTPFDLQRGPLLRAKLVQMETHKYLFVFSMHHIISDFISMEVLKKELFQLYDFFNPGKMNSLEPLKIQYKDFVYWQKKQLDGQELDRLREFWLNRLGGSLPVLQLPLDKVRPKIQTNNGEKIVFSIPEGLTGKLRTIAKENDVTLFMILMTTVNLLLFFYSGQDDIIIGVPVSGREHLDVENQIGFYLNTLALRIKFSGENTYLKLLEIVKKMALEAYEHQMYPFDKLIDDLKIKREPGRHPLFDVMADMINLNQGVPFDDLSQEQVETDGNEESIKVHRGRSKFDLTFYFFEEIKRITIIFEYSTDLFERKTVLLMAKRYKKMLKKIIANPLASLTTIIEDEKIAIPTFGSFPAG